MHLKFKCGDIVKPVWQTCYAWPIKRKVGDGSVMDGVSVSLNDKQLFIVVEVDDNGVIGQCVKILAGDRLLWAWFDDLRPAL